MSSGVVKEKRLKGAGPLRSVFQRTFPVAVSRATIKRTLAPSPEKTSRSSTTMGDPPAPWTGANVRSRLRQSTLPFRSRQAVPRWPKWTKSLSPLTTGVGLA
jgi:hypothetical protein